MPVRIGDRMSRIVLVVDDDPGSRSLIRDVLASDDLEIVQAGGGLEAVQLMHERKPDLVIMDVLMPGLNGFEACRQIKSDPELRLTPVVLITGLADRQSRLTGLACGANDFLSKPFDPTELTARTHSLLALKSQTDELERAELVLMTLGRSIEARDPFTNGHCERLSDRAVTLSRRAGFPEDEIEALRIAGFVHDIGKVAVPDAILLKPGPLTGEEQGVMRLHPETGEAICRPLKTFASILPIIRHHHERLDGSGYPDSLRGDQIPRTARVLSIVDVYDALTERRPYRTALPPGRAVEILKEEVDAGYWDAVFFAIFVEQLREEFGGSLDRTGA
jgi:putative two-component system response regulator